MGLAKTTTSFFISGLLWASSSAYAGPDSRQPIIYRGASPAPATVTAPAAVGEASSHRIMFRYPGATPRPQAEMPTSGAPAADRLAGGSTAPLNLSDALAGPPPEPAPTGLSSTPVLTDSFDLATTPVRITADPNKAGTRPTQYAGLTTDRLNAATPPAPGRATILPGARLGSTTPPNRISERATPVQSRTPVQLSSVVARPGTTLEEQAGLVGVYPDGFDGQPTANGEIYKASTMTAAHPTLPLPSLVHITNDRTGREIVVRVNDRGPFYGMGEMEISAAAATALNYAGHEPEMLRYRYLGPAPVIATDQPAPREDLFTAAVPDPAPNAPVTVTDEPAPAPRPAIQPVSSQEAYFVQAGSFSDIGNAQRLSQGLDRGLPVEIRQVRVNNTDFFRVMVGPFPTRSEAMLHRDQLDAAGIASGYIRKQ